MSKPDIVIRGGQVIDGSGAAARTADVAIAGDRIVAVGQVAARGAREIDADGALVTPGFVDIHTHYDGQATWDSRLTPSAFHGVTTVVMGNCGVGFAPVHPGDHGKLIELMEGVEDIPEAVLSEGLPWTWQSFPQYLDALEALPHDIDFATHLPHAALRLFVMGERGTRREPANADDMAAMQRIATEAVRAGAIGFSTSRTLNHRSSKGDPTPSLTASRDELVAIATGVGAAGKGVLQVISDFVDLDDEFATLRAMVRASGRPLSLSLAQGIGSGWREILANIESANAEGLTIRGQVAPRAIGVLMGLTCTLNPFISHPSYQAIHRLPLAERVRRMADPAFREQVIAEQPGPTYDRLKRLVGNFDRIWVLGNPPDYEPRAEDSIGARARALGVPALQLAWDEVVKDDGRAILYTPFANYAEYNLDVCREMIVHANTVMGLGDGGAHGGTICDASYSTYLLSHWGRDRTRGERLPLELLVKAQARDTAHAVGLDDRGILAPGMKADVNVIDFAHLGIDRPRIVHDLPAGGARLVQHATGYLHTLVSGQETYRNGVATDALPGRLVRGQQPAPTA